MQTLPPKKKPMKRGKKKKDCQIHTFFHKKISEYKQKIINGENNVIVRCEIKERKKEREKVDEIKSNNKKRHKKHRRPSPHKKVQMFGFVFQGSDCKR